MIELLAAFQFLTIFPPVIKRPFTAKELGRSSVFYPAVGLVLGLILLLAFRMLSGIFPLPVVSAAVLVLWIVLTRAIHFDGFLDACDGLYGGFTPERRLEIMRDSRIGAFAMAGGALLIILIFVGISNSQNAVSGLVLAPVLGRWALSFSLTAFPYAREKGMGRDIKDNAGFAVLAGSTLITSAAAYFIGGPTALVIFAAAVVFCWLWLKYVLKMIPGLTGDIYGATCIMVEVLVLLVYCSSLV